jgi:hypothetical protein
MKKLLLSVAAFAMIALGSAAAATEVTVNAGITSNYINRGISATADSSLASNPGATGPSATAGVKVKIENGLFGSAQMYTVRPGDGTNLEMIGVVGFSKNAGGVDYSVGYSQHFYTGAGTASKDRNYGEMFGQASYLGVNALVAQTVVTTANGSNDTFVRVGYTTPTFYGITGDIGTSYTFYRDSGERMHTATDLSVSYQVQKNTKLVVLYSLGGLNAGGVQLANQASVGVNVGF